MASIYQNIIDAVKLVGVTIGGADTAAVYRAQIIPATLGNHTRAVMTTTSDGRQHLMLETYDGDKMIASKEVSPDDIRTLAYIAANLLSMYRDRIVILEAAKAMGITNKPGSVFLPVDGYIFSYDVRPGASGNPVITNFRVQSNKVANGEFPIRIMGDMPHFSDEELAALTKSIGIDQSRMDKWTALSKLLTTNIPQIENQDITLLFKRDDNEQAISALCESLIRAYGDTAIDAYDYEKALRIEIQSTEYKYRKIDIIKKSPFVENPTSVDFTKDVALNYTKLERYNGKPDERELHIDASSDKELIDSVIKDVAGEYLRTGRISKYEYTKVLDSFSEVKEEEQAATEDNKIADDNKKSRRGAPTIEERVRICNGQLYDNVCGRLRLIAELGGDNKAEHTPVFPTGMIAQSFTAPYIQAVKASLLFDAANKGYATAVYLKNEQLEKYGLNVARNTKPVQTNYVITEVCHVNNHKTSSLSLSEYKNLSEKTKANYELRPKAVVMPMYNIDQTDLRQQNPDLYNEIVNTFGTSSAISINTPASDTSAYISTNDSLTEAVSKALVGNITGKPVSISAKAARNLLSELESLDRNEAVETVVKSVAKAHAAAYETAKGLTHGGTLYPVVNLEKELKINKSNNPKI